MKRHLACLGRLVPACQLLVTLGLLTGYASQQVVYEKPGASEADRTRDQSACVRVALTSSQPAQIGIATVDRDVFAQCMEAKGYTLRQK
jgi:hypothetical protein